MPSFAPAPVASPYAAVFIDFENVYYFLKNHYKDPHDLHDHVLALVRALRETLKREQGLDSLVLNAYADFEKMPAGPQGPLYLMGVDTRNVLGTSHKNAADMQLCIDALEVLYTRPDIGTFVLVGGDRDYIPLLQHLRRQARRVRVVGFEESMSGDLREMLPADDFTEAHSLLAPERIQALRDHRAARLLREEQTRQLRESGLPGQKTAAAQQAELDAAIRPPAAEATAALAEAPAVLAPLALAAEPPAPPLTKPAASATTAALAAASVSAPAAKPALVRDENDVFRAAPRLAPPAAGPPAPRAPSLLERLLEETPPPFAPVRALGREAERRCLRIILEQLNKFNSSELWAGPFLRQLTDLLPELPDFERRQLVNGLRDAGALRLEKRNGEPHPYTVIVVNHNHPAVRELNPGPER